MSYFFPSQSEIKEWISKISEELTQDSSPEYAFNLMNNEPFLFQILENIYEADQPLNRISLCLVLLLIDYWKERKYNQDLPKIFHNYITITDKCIYFNRSYSSSNENFNDARSAIDMQSSQPSKPLAFFSPKDQVGEKRLYRIMREDVIRLAKNESWNKIPSIKECHLWIKLPDGYFSLKSTYHTARLKIGKSISDVNIASPKNYFDENVAQLLFRRRESTKRLSGSPTLKSSKFRKVSQIFTSQPMNDEITFSPQSEEESTFKSQPAYFKKEDIPTNRDPSNKTTKLTITEYAVPKDRYFSPTKTNGSGDAVVDTSEDDACLFSKLNLYISPTPRTCICPPK